MALIELHVATALLERIAIALERIAGPPPREYKPQRTELSDIFRVTDEQQQDRQEELRNAARNAGIVPGSEAYYKFVGEIERMEREERQNGEEVRQDQL